MAYIGNHSTYRDEQQIDVAHPDYVPFAARRAPRVASSNAATEPQLGFIASLLGKPQIQEIDRIRFEAELTREVSKRRASEIINELKAALATAAPVKNSFDEAAAEGVYELNGTFYAVRPTRADATRRYAHKAIITDSSVNFEYSKGTVYHLGNARRLGLAEVEALSLQFSRCFLCGTPLKAKASKARGVGPVCAKKI